MASGEEILTKRPGQINDLKIVDVLRIGTTPIYPFSTAITSGVTTTTKAAGALAITAHATGRGIWFVSDGTYWVASDATTLPVKATGAEINTGSNDAKFATPLAIADSNVAFVADIPVKATGAEINTGTDDAKFATPLAIATATINRGNTASYLRDATGTLTLLGGNPTVRQVIIVVKIVTTFAAGDGAAPIFDIGETGTVEKFKADLTTGTAGDTLIYAGVLSGDAALLVTATAATGTTSTGAIDVTVLAVPDGS